MEKYCTKCQTTKSISKFYRNKNISGGLSFYCKECHNTNTAKSYAKHKQKRLVYMRKHTQELVREFIAAYGGVCECCGEDEWTFLTLDHISNNSRKPHQGMKSFSKLLELRRRGWPREEYRLHCFNCNLGRERSPGQICVHKKGR
ncbi:hypothetical protein LCGC14_0938880 [marine sediment metagenome]|uniref:Uncharacterized protein n=1 Tax=marine sediment metagenome TaxID=412755 RepID=A0A0F9NKP8_9ZZZZ